MAKDARAVKQIEPLLFPLHQLLALSDSSRRLHSQAEDQYTDTNKFTLLHRALKSGSIASAKILISFARPIEFMNETFDNKKSYLRYLFAAVILGDEASLEELYQVIDSLKKLNDIYLLRDIILGYQELGFVLQPYLEKLTQRFSEFEQKESGPFIHSQLLPKPCELPESITH